MAHADNTERTHTTTTTTTTGSGAGMGFVVGALVAVLAAGQFSPYLKAEVQYWMFALLMCVAALRPDAAREDAESRVPSAKIGGRAFGAAAIARRSRGRVHSRNTP